MFAALLLAVVAQAPPAEGPVILGRDDLDFARRLSEAGFHDLAREVCDAIVSKGENGGDVSKADVTTARILSFEAETSEATGIEDTVARRARLQDVLDRGEAFSKTLVQGPELDRLNAALAGAQEAYAMILLEEVDNEKDPAVAAKMRKDASKIFKNAVDALTARIEANEKAMFDAESDADVAALDRKLIVDMYSKARMLYLHSRLLAADDSWRQLVLGDALEAFQAFDFSYGQELLSYEGNIYQGLCHKELGNDEAALEAFDYAISLRERFEAGPDNRFKVTPEAANIISFAVLQKMQFLREKKDFRGAAETAQDFLDSIPSPLQSLQGPAVMLAQARSLGEAGDVAGLQAAAQTLAEFDPRGPWGAAAKDLLTNPSLMAGGGGASTPPSVLLGIAETLFAKGENQRGHQTCAQARDGARGTAAEQDIGADSFMLEGDAYAREGSLFEAAAAYEAPGFLYPKGTRTPNSLWNAVSAYNDLYGSEQLAWFRNQAKDRSDLLARSYPKHEVMASAALITGLWAEADGDLAGAEAVFAKVPKGSPGYGEAQRRLGANLLKQAKKAEDEKKTADAARLKGRARETLETARRELEAGMSQTLDTATRARLGALAFGARADIARILLGGTAKEAAEVISLLEDVEAVYAGDEAKQAEAWRLRINSLEKQGKLDEAVTMLDGLVARSPDTTAIGPAAGLLARSLDREANALQEKTPGSKEAAELWKQAARLYGLSVKPQVAGRVPRNRQELEAVGTRLLALALTLEGAPEGVDSFIDWTPAALSRPELWEQVKSILQAVLESGSSYRSEIYLGRVLGVQGQWREAAMTYSHLFDREQIMDISGKKMDVARIREKPELVPAYVEWAMAESMAGSTGDDRERLSRADELLKKALPNLQVGEKLWWRARVLQVQNFVWQGRYEEADIALRDLERNTADDFDQGKFGAKERLLQLKAEVARKVVR